jgi:hypothetical protein
LTNYKNRKTGIPLRKFFYYSVLNKRKIYVQEKHNIPSAAKFGFGQLWVLKFLQFEQLELFVRACLKT